MNADELAALDRAATQELLPCPFCGGEAEWRDDPGICSVPFGLIVSHNKGCFLLGVECGQRETILAAWRTRTHAAEAALVATGEAAATHLKRWMASEVREAKLREVLEVADYLISLHERIARREPVRDIAEAQGSYRRLRAAREDPPMDKRPWETCRIGSCQRHQGCMYAPCRNLETSAVIHSSEESIRAACVEAEIAYTDFLKLPRNDVARNAILALARRIEAEREAVPVGWEWTMFMEHEQTRVALTTGKQDPFGEPGQDYSAEYRVTRQPLYAHPPKEPTT